MPMMFDLHDRSLGLMTSHPGHMDIHSHRSRRQHATFSTEVLVKALPPLHNLDNRVPGTWLAV